MNSPPTESVARGILGKVGRFIARNCSMTSASDRCSAAPSLHVILSASRARNASPKERATTATPEEFASTSNGTSLMARTPGRPIASESSYVITQPPKLGGLATTVGIASGMSRSIAKSSLPVTISRASARFCGVPIILYCDGSLGFASRAASLRPSTPAVSSEYAMRLPSLPIAKPFSVLISFTEIPKCTAADNFILCNSAAATLRNGSQREVTA